MKLSETYLGVLQVFKASPSRYLNEGFKKTIWEIFPCISRSYCEADFSIINKCEHKAYFVMLNLL